MSTLNWTTPPEDMSDTVLCMNFLPVALAALVSGACALGVDSESACQDEAFISLHHSDTGRPVLDGDTLELVRGQTGGKFFPLNLELEDNALADCGAPVLAVRICLDSSCDSTRQRPELEMPILLLERTNPLWVVLPVSSSIDTKHWTPVEITISVLDIRHSTVRVWLGG